MRRLMMSSLICIAAVSTPAVAADTPLAGRAPGLWEIRLVDGSSLASIALGVEQMIRNLPESQRRQMELLMGGNRPQLPTTIRQCLTPELANKDLKTQLAEHDIQCKELDWQESGGSGRFSFVCTNPDGDWTGQGRVWDATDKQFMSEAKVQGKYKGQPVSLDMKHEARWLGADCQGVQPLK